MALCRKQVRSVGLAIVVDVFLWQRSRGYCFRVCLARLDIAQDDDDEASVSNDWLYYHVDDISVPFSLSHTE